MSADTAGADATDADSTNADVTQADATSADATSADATRSDAAPSAPGPQVPTWIAAVVELARRFLPVAAAALDRLVRRTPHRRSSRPVAAGRLQLAPDARRVLGALAVVLLISAAALVLIGT